MAYDFRTDGLRTGRLIASGTTDGIGLLIYSSSNTGAGTGGYRGNLSAGLTNRLSTVGNDVWLYVDGVPSNDPRFGTSRTPQDGNQVVLFKGDVVVSGTLYASTQVIRVDESVEGNLWVPNDLYVSGTGVFNNARSADSDFIVRSQNRSHAIFVDSSNSRVGIGFGVEETNDRMSSWPTLDSTLHVAEPNGQMVLTLENEKSGSGAGDVQIDFKLGGTTKWSVGVDDSDNDKFNIVSAGTLGTNRYVTVGGASQNEVVINDDAASIDFRVEGANADSLFLVDASLDAVSIKGAADDISDLFEVKFLAGGSDQPALTVGSDDGETREVVINEGQNEIDFRVETISNTNAILVSGSDSAVYITGGTRTGTAVTIDSTGAGGDILVRANSGPIQITTTTSGEIDVTSAGLVDINAGAGIDIDDTGVLGNGGITIDTTDASAGITIGTATSGVPITIGHSTSEVTIADNLTVTGDLHVDGDTVYTNVTTMTIQDPIIDIGGGVDGAAPTSDDNKDRGLSFQWFSGVSAKKGFIGYDDSASVFTMIPDATINSEVVSGNPGTLRVRQVDLYDDGAESISGDGTDIDFTLGAGGDINIPSDIGLTFGADTQKIEGDSSNNLSLSAGGDVTIDADGGNIILSDGGVTYMDIAVDGTTDKITVTGGLEVETTGDVLLDSGGNIVLDTGQDVTIQSGGTDSLIFRTDGNHVKVRGYLPNGTTHEILGFYNTKFGSSEYGSLRFANTKVLEFRDTDLKIYSSADGQLDIDADTEIEVTTTTLDINATTTDISGDLNVAGTLTPGTLSVSDLTLGASGQINFGSTDYQIVRDSTQLKFKDGVVTTLRSLSDFLTVDGIGPFEALSTETAGGWTGGPGDTLKIRTTGSFSVDGSNQYAEAYGGNIHFFVSGSVGRDTSAATKKAVFGGDLVVSGNVNLGMWSAVYQGPGVDPLKVYGKPVLAVSGTTDRPMALVSGSLRFQTQEMDYVGEITPGYNYNQSESEQDIYFRNIRSSGMIRFQSGGSASSKIIADFRGDSQALRFGSGKKIEFAGTSRYIESSATTSINYVNSNAGGRHTFTGHILPSSDNTYDLGSSTLRFANVYTGDLNLRNERGDWTILEEEDYLCVINNKTGKKFKMMLEPIEENE